MLDVNPESWLVVLGYREKVEYTLTASAYDVHVRVRGHERFCHLQKKMYVCI